MKTKFFLSFVISCITMICIFQSCGEDAPVTNNNQNTGGSNATQIGTPNGPPVTLTIGASGGSITSADSSFELIVPPGALSSSTEITVQSIENFCFNSYGDAFKLSPEGQQFGQPVTVKFHYSEEVLASTHEILMGIAQQDAVGRWHYFNSISNDTVNMVISVELTQFGYPGDNLTGGGDISFFDIAHLEPRSSSVAVNNTVGLFVSYEALPDSDGELRHLPRPIGSWWVNGVQNGDPTIGTIINRQGQSATFKAPAQVPSPDIVLAGALVNTGFNYRGRVIETYLLQSPVKILPAIVQYDLKVDMNWPDFWWGIIEYHCTYYDGADMVLTVNQSTFPPSLSISDTVNREANVVPSSGTYPNGQGSITWVPDGKGIINIRGLEIFSSSVHGDTIQIAFSHLPVLTPKFHCVPPIGEPYDVGGTQGIGFPTTGLQFRIRNHVQYYTIENEHITGRLTPRN